MDDFNERTLILLRDDNLKMADTIEKMERDEEKAMCHILELKDKNLTLLLRLENVQKEAEVTKELANSLHNELLTMRGQITAYKHCVAAMTGGEIPLETIGQTPAKPA